MTGEETVLIIPDLQAPFQHPDTIDFLAAVEEVWEPTEYVCIGDEVDFHALSDYEHDPDGYSAGHELEAAKEFLFELYEYFPDMKVCVSNHTSRPFRRAKKYGIPRAFLKDYHEFLEAPEGWEWKDHFYIDGVRYEHGDALGGVGHTAPKRMVLQNMESTVFGHFHAGASIQWVRTHKKIMFGMNVGCMIDHDAYAFRYWKGPKSEIICCAIVDRGIPTIVPMVLEKGGRWCGELF